MMKQTPISARINSNVLKYIKECHQPVNSLINSLLEDWMKKRQKKELLLFQEETGTDELSQLSERHTERNSQCCINCTNYNNRFCKVMLLTFYLNNTNKDPRKFCCIYWEKKKERS